MKVTINEKGYVENYAFAGSLDGSEDVANPSDSVHFEAHYPAYRIRDGNPVFDEEEWARLAFAAETDLLRKRREAECFPIINRGALWYERLTPERRRSLLAWYEEWLNVTGTRKLPVRPDWLK